MTRDTTTGRSPRLLPGPHRFPADATVVAVLPRFAIVALLLLPACTAPKSRLCRDTCAREAECVGAKTTEDDTNFDEGECIAACAALEADAETRKLVSNHADCVSRAQ